MCSIKGKNNNLQICYISGNKTFFQITVDLLYVYQNQVWGQYVSNLGRVTEEKSHLDSLVLQQLEAGIFASMMTKSILSIDINKAILVTYKIILL